MIKRILILILKLFVGIIITALVSYAAFLGSEFITGGRYVEYLSLNSENKSLDKNFDYNIMEEDLINNDLILVGEMHGFDEPTKFDVDFFKYLYNKHGLRYYFAELDYSQAEYMNQYLESGNDSLLARVLKNWIVAQGRNNKDYYDKYRAFHLFHKQLSDGEKFKFVGVDKIQDWPLLTDYINSFNDVDTLLKPLKYNSKTIIVHLKQRIKYMLSKDNLPDESIYSLKHILLNIAYKELKENREEVMFKNFRTIYEDFHLQNQKLYGYFGVAHVFQYMLNNHATFASHIRESNMGLEGKMISMNFLFVDSDMVMDSKQLPEFLRTGPKYSSMKISADNILFMYIYGIGDFKQMTPKYTKSLIKMNGLNNPYADSKRLTNTFRVFPVFPTFEMTEKGKPYVQYTIFVRNSAWAEPIDN